jgi:hypothetical protein
MAFVPNFSLFAGFVAVLLAGTNVPNANAAGFTCNTPQVLNTIKQKYNKEATDLPQDNPWSAVITKMIRPTIEKESISLLGEKRDPANDTDICLVHYTIILKTAVDSKALESGLAHNETGTTELSAKWRLEQFGNAFTVTELGRFDEATHVSKEPAPKAAISPVPKHDPLMDPSPPGESDVDRWHRRNHQLDMGGGGGQLSR